VKKELKDELPSKDINLEGLLGYMASGEEKDRDLFMSSAENLLARGSCDQIKSVLIGLLSDSGHKDDLRIGQFSVMTMALLKVLVWARDHQGKSLTFTSILEFLPLEKAVSLSKDTSIDKNIRAPLERYLFEIPGYTNEDAEKNDIDPEAYAYHGFLTMGLVEAMTGLLMAELAESASNLI